MDHLHMLGRLTMELTAVQALAGHPTSAVLERLHAFRARVVPGQALPYFTVRGALAEPGTCSSCGEAWEGGGRCVPCSTAAHLLANELRRELKVVWRNPEVPAVQTRNIPNFLLEWP